MNETQVTMIGNAVEDPVRRVGKTGTTFVTFRLASTVRRRHPDTGAFVDVGTNFITVLAFRQLAANVAASVRKGQPVLVTGRLRITQWSAGERTGTSVELDATSVGHDLSWGQSSFIKVRDAGRLGQGSFPAAAAAPDHGTADGSDSGLSVAGPPGQSEHQGQPGEPGEHEEPGEFDDDALGEGPLPPYGTAREEGYLERREPIGA